MLTTLILILLTIAGATAYLRRPTATPTPPTPTVQPCPNHRYIFTTNTDKPIDATGHRSWIRQTEDDVKKDALLARIAKMGIRPGETHNLHLR